MGVTINTQLLVGLDHRDIDFDSLQAPLHRQLLAPFRALQHRARAEGMELAIASGYRSFERQLAIWNAKARGERPLLDSDGQPLNPAELSPWETVQAILRWSALPGASRHHWGTDLDIYDRNAVPEDYQVQLSLEEVHENGPFGPLHCWLDTHIAAGDCENFFRPYEVDRGGVAPERWHLSYAPLARQFQAGLTLECLAAVLQEQPLALKGTVLSHLDEIYQRFVVIPEQCYPNG